jgi:hypothetical protein
MDSKSFAVRFRPFRFPLRHRIPILDDGLAEIICARQILSSEAHCIGLSLDHVFHKWTIIASEESEV